ncbi:MAG: ArsR/SmtB family transcription factor [Actinomycetota bacterium]
MDALGVVAEPRRREILRLIWDEERSAGVIAGHFDVSFAAVSQHLRVLRTAGFVTSRRDGRQRFYRANKKGVGDLRPVLTAMWRANLDRLADLAEEAER